MIELATESMYETFCALNHMVAETFKFLMLPQTQESFRIELK